MEDTAGNPIPGLYACGEMVGGLFYHNYASGTGLMSGAVFGRIAGRSAAGIRRTDHDKIVTVAADLQSGRAGFFQEG